MSGSAYRRQISKISKIPPLPSSSKKNKEEKLKTTSSAAATVNFIKVESCFPKAEFDKRSIEIIGDLEGDRIKNSTTNNSNSKSTEKVGKLRKYKGKDDENNFSSASSASVSGSSSISISNEEEDIGWNEKEIKEKEKLLMIQSDFSESEDNSEFDEKEKEVEEEDEFKSEKIKKEEESSIEAKLKFEKRIEKLNKKKCEKKNLIKSFDYQDPVILLDPKKFRAEAKKFRRQPSMEDSDLISIIANPPFYRPNLPSLRELNAALKTLKMLDSDEEIRKIELHEKQTRIWDNLTEGSESESNKESGEDEASSYSESNSVEEDVDEDNSEGSGEKEKTKKMAKIKKAYGLFKKKYF